MHFCTLHFCGMHVVGFVLSSNRVKERARGLGFDLCGIAPAAGFPELQFLGEWLARGYAGNMGYLPRTADRRQDVRRVLPSAQSVIVTGTLYNTDRPVLGGTPRAR